MAGHEVVSSLAFIAPFLLSYVGFSRPSNRGHLWRYLSKLSKESSFIQWCYDLYTINNVRHGLAEIINKITIKLPRSSEAQGLSASNHCGDFRCIVFRNIFFWIRYGYS